MSWHWSPRDPCAIRVIRSGFAVLAADVKSDVFSILIDCMSYKIHTIWRLMLMAHAKEYNVSIQITVLKLMLKSSRVVAFIVPFYID